MLYASARFGQAEVDLTKYWKQTIPLPLLAEAILCARPSELPQMLAIAQPSGVDCEESRNLGRASKLGWREEIRK